MAIYNLAIHAGRAVSFASGAFLGVPYPDIMMNAPGFKDIVGGAATESATAAAAAATAAAAVTTAPDGVIMLPLDQLSDLASLGAHTILYMTADTLVLAPSAAMDVLGDAVLKLGLTWRDIFTAVAIPGFLLSPILLFTVEDPGRKFTGSRMMRRKARAAATRVNAHTATNTNTVAKMGIGAETVSSSAADQAPQMAFAAKTSKSSPAARVNAHSATVETHVATAAEPRETTKDEMVAGRGVEVLEPGQEGAIVDGALVDAALSASRDFLVASATIAAENVAITSTSEGTKKKEKKRAAAVAATRAVPRVRPMVMRRDGPATTLPLRPADRLDVAMLECLKSPPFLAVTGAAMLNDLGGWSLIAFQSAFYERTFDLGPEVYNPMLAWIIPLSGVIGRESHIFFFDHRAKSLPLFKCALASKALLTSEKARPSPKQTPPP